jgi:hypothetical protein
LQIEDPVMAKMRLCILFCVCLSSTAIAQEKWPTLTEAIAEADRLDPGWRFDELIATQPKIAGEENSAPVVAALYEDLAKAWKIPEVRGSRPPKPPEPTTLEELWLDIPDLLKRYEPKPSERCLHLLKEYEETFAPFLLRARALSNYKSGRTQIHYQFNIIDTDLPHLRRAADLRRLLAIDGYRRAIRADIDGGLQSARALLGLGRSFGNEPFLASQITQNSVKFIAADLIAFVLSQGDASEAALLATQTTLASELAPNPLLYSLRAERATQYDVCDKVAAGKINIKALAYNDPESRMPDGIERPEHRVSQAIDLHMLTMAVEIAKKPTWQQVKLWDEWNGRVRALSPVAGERHLLAAVLLPVAGMSFSSDARARSLLVTIETIIGFERIRITRKRWPKPGESLLPVFPEGLPIDPLSGNPILWKATERELLVYSVGLDQKDNGGEVKDNRSYVPRTDLGYRIKKAG